MKFLIGLVLFLCCFKEVDAKVYYSEYTDFSKYNTEVVEESDIVDVEVERRYKWYQYVAQGDFYRMGENPFSYNYTNTGIYKDGQFSQWSRECPDEYFGRLIETREICTSGECVNEYRYRDRFYYFYKEVKKEREGYYTYLLHYSRETDDYKDYYRYRTRDKIEIPESIIITSNDKTLDDFIKSTVDYEIIGNIDYSKNGLYEVVIKTDFIEVHTVVEVLNLQPIKSSYENLIMNKQSLLEEKESLIEDLEKQLIIGIEERKKEKQSFDNLLFSKQKLIETIEGELADKKLLLDELNLKYESQQIQFDEEITLCMQEVNGLKEQKEKQEERILDLMQEISNKNNILTKVKNNLDNSKERITYLESNKSDNEILDQKYEDILKKYELCNKTNETLQLELDEKEEINSQGFLNIIFWVVIVIIVIVSLIRIKSMKKMN